MKNTVFKQAYVFYAKKLAPLPAPLFRVVLRLMIQSGEFSVDEKWVLEGKKLDVHAAEAAWRIWTAEDSEAIAMDDILGCLFADAQPLGRQPDGKPFSPADQAAWASRGLGPGLDVYHEQMASEVLDAALVAQQVKRRRLWRAWYRDGRYGRTEEHDDTEDATNGRRVAQRNDRGDYGDDGGDGRDAAAPPAHVMPHTTPAGVAQHRRRLERDDARSHRTSNGSEMATEAQFFAFLNMPEARGGGRGAAADATRATRVFRDVAGVGDAATAPDGGGGGGGGDVATDGGGDGAFGGDGASTAAPGAAAAPGVAGNIHVGHAGRLVPGVAGDGTGGADGHDGDSDARDDSDITMIGDHDAARVAGPRDAADALGHAARIRAARDAAMNAPAEGETVTLDYA